MPKFKWFSVISESIQNIPFLPPNGFPSPSSPFSSSFGVSSELPLLLLNSPSHQLLLLLPLQRCVDALFPYLHGHPFHLDPYYFMPGLLQVSIWWTTAKLIFMQSHVNWICIAFWPGVWTIIWSRLTLFQIIGWPNFSNIILSVTYKRGRKAKHHLSFMNCLGMFPASWTLCLLDHFSPDLVLVPSLWLLFTFSLWYWNDDVILLPSHFSS